jgi:hypothetical protein
MAELLQSLAALERTLSTASGPACPLTPEQVEARVDRITALMARSAYDEAAQASEALLAEGLQDVRLITPCLFGAFLEHGPRALPALFSALHRVLTRGWEQLGPRDKKPVVADSGLLWLFKSLHKHLEFHGRAQDAEWRKWCESCGQSQVQEALQRAGELLELLEQRLPKGGGATRLLQLTGWLTENRELFSETPSRSARAQAEEPPQAQAVSERREEEFFPDPAEEEEEDEEEVSHEDEPGELESRAEADGKEEVRLAAGPPPQPQVPPPSGLEPSPAFEQLLHKLAAFDQLVERQDFTRASMVATDVLHVIDHFDPLVYLPSLFSRFLSGLSTHAESLEPRMQGSRSLGERALERLYRTDLQAFLRATSGMEDAP